MLVEDKFGFCQEPSTLIGKPAIETLSTVVSDINRIPSSTGIVNRAYLLYLIYMLGVTILPLSASVVLDFGTVPTVWYFLFFILLPDFGITMSCLRKRFSIIKCHTCNLNVKALAYLELAVSDDSKKSLNVCRFMNSVCDKLQNVKREDFINLNWFFFGFFL